MGKDKPIVCFGKYNPSFSTLLFGTGPNNIVNYYLGHSSKANYGLILPHSSVFSMMIFFGIIGEATELISVVIFGILFLSLK